MYRDIGKAGRRGRRLAALTAVAMLVFSCGGSTKSGNQQSGGGESGDAGGATAEGGEAGATQGGGGTAQGGTAGGGGDNGGTGAEMGGVNATGGASGAAGSDTGPCIDRGPVEGEPCTQGCYFVDCEGAGITTFSCNDGLIEIYDITACEPFICDDQNAPQQCAGDEVCVTAYTYIGMSIHHFCYPYPCADPGLFTDECVQLICENTQTWPYADMGGVIGPRFVSCYDQ